MAILMMVVYHLAYDLDVFGGYDINSTTGGWALFADATAFSFLFLVGVSLAISHHKARERQPEGGLFGKYLLRGLRVFGYGLIITAAFWLFGMGWVVFGILHLIGASIILAYPFLSLRLPNLVLGLAVLAAGLYLNTLELSTQSPWLLPLGVAPEGLFMPDYRPLLPWFGVVLIGLFFGNVLYAEDRMRFFPQTTPAVARPLIPLGRRSLLVYMVHQPILISLLALTGVIQLGIF